MARARFKPVVATPSCQRDQSHGNFQGDLAADRGTTAAATTSASVRRSIRAARGDGSGLHLASVLQERRKDANVFASSGVIWRILDRGIGPSLLALALKLLPLLLYYKGNALDLPAYAPVEKPRARLLTAHRG
jgi:hypothetical protein